jgi:hypothetical protein
MAVAFGADRGGDWNGMHAEPADARGAIISGPDLQGASLAGSNEALKVTLSPITLDSLARVWWAIQVPYRLSLSYEVRVVNLDSETAERATPVSSRTLAYGQGSVAP